MKGSFLGLFRVVIFKGKPDKTGSVFVGADTQKKYPILPGEYFLMAYVFKRLLPP